MIPLSNYLVVGAILFVTLVLCAIGAWLIGSFPVAILPEVTFPRLVVIADSGDRPARMMVAGVTRPVEEAIATVPGVTRTCQSPTTSTVGTVTGSTAIPTTPAIKKNIILLVLCCMKNLVMCDT